MKVRVQANRLEKGDVAYISLVERGANRAPFKVMKQDKGQNMIDLSRVFKGDSQAKIVGYVLKSEDRNDAVDAAFKGLGIVTDKAVEFNDGTMVYKQEEFDLKDAKGGIVAIKMDEDFVLLAKGFDPYNVGESMGFNDIIKSQGFMPGLSMAMEALGTSVRQSLYSADDQAAAVAKVEEALDQFHEYAAKLAAAIPTTAFKALESFRKTKAEDVKLAGELASDEDKKHYAALKTAKEKSAFLRMSKEDRSKVAKADAGAADAVAKKAEQEATAKAEATLEGDVKDHYTKLAAGDKPAFLKMKPDEQKVAAKAKKDADAAVAAAGATDAGKDTVALVTAAMAKATDNILGRVTEMMGGVTKSVTDLGTKVEGVAAVAKEAKDTAEKVQKAARGLIVGDANEDADEAAAAAERARKSEHGGMQIDTAFQRNVRKAAPSARYAGRQQRVAN